jgi:hypothetical protein
MQPPESAEVVPLPMAAAVAEDERQASDEDGEDAEAEPRTP